MNDRHSAAAQNRMKLIAETAFPSTEPADDTFGANDKDWEIYLAISNERDSESEEEESKLAEVDSLLIKYDQNYLKNTGPKSEDYQIQLKVERINIPEILFQPSIIGLESAGLIETLQHILNRFSIAEQNLLLQNVYLTGGNSIYPYFKERLELELRAIRPFQSHFEVTRAGDCILDAWRGARAFSNHSNFQQMSILKADYEERGPDYFVKHFCSNLM